MALADPFVDPKLHRYHGGFIPTPDDPRDYRLPHLAHRAKTARPSVDLRQYQGQSLMIPIRDQGAIGSCTGMAWARLRAAAAAKYHIDRGERPDLGDDISAAFLYDLERQMAGNYPNDTGANMRDGGDVINQYGVCPERYYPYTGRANNGPLDKAITLEAYQAALDYGISTYYRLGTTGQSIVDQLIGCIDSNWCAVIAILVPPSFENIGRDGRVPMPSRGEQVLGGHALCVCGYYQDNSYPGGYAFVVANSWGEGYGDGGYCYLPAAWATTSSGVYGNWLQEAWCLQ